MSTSGVIEWIILGNLLCLLAVFGVGAGKSSMFIYNMSPGRAVDDVLDGSRLKVW